MSKPNTAGQTAKTTAKKTEVKADSKPAASSVLVSCTVNQPAEGKIGVVIGGMVMAPGKRLRRPADEVKELIELGLVTAG